MLKLIYELLKNNFSITGNLLYDLLICGIIIKILDTLVYHWVGDMYRSDIIDGRFAGHILNFTIKIILLLIIMYIVSVVHMFLKFIGAI